MWSLWLFVLLESRLIATLQVTSTAKQYSFADDAGKTGSTTEMKRYKDFLSTLGPDFGYFSNGKEWWIIAKPDKKESVKEVFKEADGMLLPLRHTQQKHAMPLHLRLKTLVNLLSRNTARHPGSTRATAECNISDTYSCDKGTPV